MIRTKEIIRDAFLELLEEKPYNKITVQDIVNRCQVNRNTFYYHFQGLHFFLGDGFFARGIDRNLIRVKK